MNIRRVWFVSHYSMPPEYEMRIKTQMYVHYLENMGIECTIFSASTIHNTDIDLISGDDEYIEKQYGEHRFVHIKCDQYKGNGFSRVKNMMQFASRFERIAAHFQLPDVVVADVNCLNYGKIYRFCKKNAIPFFIDMRDLWPDSIVEYLNYSKRNPIVQYLYHRERLMYQRADGIIFSMEGGKQYVKDKNWKEIDLEKIHYINNGVDITQFNNNVKKYSYYDDDLEKRNYKIVYTGSVRTANNLEAIVKAAELISDPEIVFLIYGNGDQKETLEEYCKKKNIQNVIFKGQVEKKYVPFILKKCNLSLLNYKKSDTWKYGGSQNKLFEYMAAGHPVLMTVKMNYNIIERYKCGIVIDEPDPQLIASKILEIKNMPKSEIERMSKNAIKAAEEFDYKKLTEKLYMIISSDRRKD